MDTGYEHSKKYSERERERETTPLCQSEGSNLLGIELKENHAHSLFKRQVLRVHTQDADCLTEIVVLGGQTCVLSIILK